MSELFDLLNMAERQGRVREPRARVWHVSPETWQQITDQIRSGNVNDVVNTHLDEHILFNLPVEIVDLPDGERFRLF